MVSYQLLGLICSLCHISMQFTFCIIAYLECSCDPHVSAVLEHACYTPSIGSNQWIMDWHLVRYGQPSIWGGGRGTPILFCTDLCLFFRDRNGVAIGNFTFPMNFENQNLTDVFDSIVHEVRLPWFLSATWLTSTPKADIFMVFVRNLTDVNPKSCMVLSVADKNHGKRTSCIIESNINHCPCLFVISLY